MTKNQRKKYVVDVAERVGATFVQAFLAQLTVVPLLGVDVPVLKQAAIAGAAAVLALVKSAAASQVGYGGTAALVRSAPRVNG